jgi:hypothetical protein
MYGLFLLRLCFSLASLGLMEKSEMFQLSAQAADNWFCQPNLPEPFDFMACIF